jgi:hypothetical protein
LTEHRDHGETPTIRVRMKSAAVSGPIAGSLKEGPSSRSRLQRAIGEWASAGGEVGSERWTRPIETWVPPKEMEQFDVRRREKEGARQNRNQRTVGAEEIPKSIVENLGLDQGFQGLELAEGFARGVERREVRVALQFVEEAGFDNLGAVWTFAPLHRPRVHLSQVPARIAQDSVLVRS